MSKNEEVSFLTHKYILAPEIRNVSLTVVVYTGLGKKVKKHSGEINPLIAHLGVTVLEVEKSFMQNLSTLLLFSADKNNS